MISMNQKRLLELFLTILVRKNDFVITLILFYCINYHSPMEVHRINNRFIIISFIILFVISIQAYYFDIP